MYAYRSFWVFTHAHLPVRSRTGPIFPNVGLEFPLRVLLAHVPPMVMPTPQRYAYYSGTSWEAWLWSVRLNLPEFTWLVTCPIVTGHYLFQCLKEMFFGYLNALGGRRESMAIENSQRARHSLVSSVYYMVRHS